MVRVLDAFTIVPLPHHKYPVVRMRQGSILAYLQQLPAAQDSAQILVKAESSVVAGGLAHEDAAAKVAKSQEIKVEVKADIRPIVNEPMTANTSSVELRDPRASIVKVFPSHIDRLKSITSTLLPVRYSDRFFTDCLNNDESSVLSYTSLFDSKPVGWIRCRVEPSPSSDNPAFLQIYIQALGVLAPYRRIGLASALLNAVMSTRHDVRSVYAHVWETNEEALQWYEKHGFQRILLVPQYYRRLAPSGAWIVRRDLP